jgi:hypothetical protein
MGLSVCEFKGEYTCCIADHSVTSTDILRDRTNKILGAYGAQLTALAGAITVPSGCCTPATLSPIDPVRTHPGPLSAPSVFSS